MMFNLLRIKVCGLREPNNIEAVCDLGPDFIGYIFYPGSKRYVGDDPDPEIFRIPGETIKKVGVFVNESIEGIMKKAEKYKLDLVQLHGSESPEYCMQLSDAGISVIKAFIVEEAGMAEPIVDYIEQVRYILFDTPSKNFGGSGEKFNWDIIQKYSIPFPFILSGGIGPDDVDKLAALEHDWLFAIDLNSRFETEPGLKNIALLKRFIELVRN